MKTQLAILALGSLLLVALHFISSRNLTIFAPWRFFIITLLSAILSQFAINGMLDLADMKRGTSVLHVIRGFNSLVSNRPVLLILGSSYTARNIDGKSLEQNLDAAGFDYQVRQMSYPGSYAYEQDYYLDQYLSKSPPPDIVMIELGTEQSLTVKPENYLKHSTIEYHDFTRMTELLSGILSRNATDVYKDSESVLIHTLARSFHLGMLHALEPRTSGPIKSGFLPEKLGSSSPPQADAINKGLYAPIAAKVADDYRNEFRLRQSERIFQAGIHKIIYWQPPSADVQQRLRSSSLCKALESSCIAFDDPALLDGAFWIDSSHLSDQGANLLTIWLANRLIRQLEIINDLR